LLLLGYKGELGAGDVTYGIVCCCAECKLFESFGEVVAFKKRFVSTNSASLLLSLLPNDSFSFLRNLKKIYEFKTQLTKK